MRSVTFHLLVGRNGTKDNFGELATVEWPVRDSSGYALVANYNLFESCIRTQLPPTDVSQSR